MATQLVHRSLPRTLNLASFLSRYISTSASLSNAPSRSSLSFIHRLRLLAGAISGAGGRFSPAMTLRCFASKTTSSSLGDPNPNWSNRPPEETILLDSLPDGCDLEHWLVVMDPPEGKPTRDEIIDMYIQTLAMVVGSDEEARMKIYSVSTKCYYAFGALVSEKLSYKIKGLPRVRWVLPDSYLDVNNKDYGGEPFINGQAVPYNVKFHEKWIYKSWERSMAFYRKNNYGGAPQGNYAPPKGNYYGGASQENYYGGALKGKNYGGAPQGKKYGGAPQGKKYGGAPQGKKYGGAQQGKKYGGAPQGNYYGGAPQGNYYGDGGVPQGNMGGGPPNSVGGVPGGNPNRN